MARIGINAIALAPNRTGGAETYIRQLLGCPDFHNALSAHDVFVFAGHPCDPVLKQDNFQLVRCPVEPIKRNHRLLWEQYAFPRLLKKINLDLVHFPYSGYSWAYGKPFVVTLHDTTNFVMPRSVSLAERLYRFILQKRLLKLRNAHVITVSQTDKDILTRLLGLAHERCSAIHHGYPPGYLIEPERIGIPRPQGELLWVGRPYYHKNVPLLLHMMADLFQSLGTTTPHLRLLGIEDERKKNFAELAEKLGISSFVSIEPPVPHATLPEYFQRAQVLVFPSKYESFGFPPLEAMCSGTPVVCSDIPIFREILGSAALFADPSQPKAFAQACLQLLADQQSWSRYARLGYARVEKFTWSQCARQTVSVYERALATASQSMALA
ncbi:glycosyltransferase family 4 protein [Desulfonatronum thiodismutans]|uniref:glycosyltransferase family 4 protein n=1 Tax=Desulfonatronum thiodismutans TaxID=159290 RepID=UPI000A0139BF|nr:glycosyltransferase family 1 protein [Desulfonatronum thiodismutans]